MLYLIVKSLIDDVSLWDAETCGSLSSVKAGAKNKAQTTTKTTAEYRQSDFNNLFHTSSKQKESDDRIHPTPDFQFPIPVTSSSQTSSSANPVTSADRSPAIHIAHADKVS